jgi:integrase
VRRPLALLVPRRPPEPEQALRQATRLRHEQDRGGGARDRLRAEIREGALVAAPKAIAAPATVTFGAVADEYLKKHVRASGRRPGPTLAAENYVRIIRATPLCADGKTISFEDKPITAITKADVEAVRDARRERARSNGAKPGRLVLPGARGGEVGVEHLMATLRGLFRWAVREGHADATPFERNGQVVIQTRTQKKQHRRRRLEPGEERRLLEAACPKGRAAGMEGHLRDLIVAALETGCRRGELLSMQWSQVKGEGMRHLDLPAEKTKTSEPRKIPITASLREVLERRRLGPDGKAHGPDAHVFGDETGGRVGRITTAWNATCRRAGIEGLRFHDLRHEFISRLLEAGVAIHKVRDWAGHRSIATTGIYANTTLAHLEDARRAFEARATAGTASAATQG